MPAAPAAPAVSARPLAGASVIVTRPVATATALVRAIRSRGGEPVRLPGLRIGAAADPAAVRRALEGARAADIWIFSSPSAVRFAAALDAPMSLAASTRVFAVGRATARALARQGIAARAPSGAQNSEGLLEDAALGDPRGRSIAIIDAPGGRDRLAPALRERGAQVERIGVYQRLPPRLGRRQFEALERAARPWLTLLTSGEALTHLLQALPESLREHWQHEALIVSSPRLAEQARAAGFLDIHRAASALTGDLIAAACAVLARHRL